MMFNSTMRQSAIFMLYATLFLFVCELPEDPRASRHASISSVFRTDDGRVHSHSVVDTVGKPINICVAITLPEYFTSIRLVVKGDGEHAEIDTVFEDFRSTESYDTVCVEHVFRTPGVRTATITPYTTLDRKPITADIMISEVKEVVDSNHTPSIEYTGATVIGPSEMCQLVLHTSDPDDDQTLTTALHEAPEGATLKDNVFSWTAPEDFTGTDTLSFIVSDNGVPVLSDTIEVIITVTATPHPPVISVSGDCSIVPLETCTLLIRAVDEDSGQIFQFSMSGAPESAKIVDDSLFLWTPPENSDSTYTVTFSVVDNGIPPLSDSIEVTITVNETPQGNSAPQWSLDTLKVAQYDTASYSRELDEISSDPDNDPMTYTLLPGDPEGDTIRNGAYFFSKISAGDYYAMILVADPSGEADTLVVALAIASSAAVDTTPPDISLADPATDTAVTTVPSLTIDLVCLDVSGIALVEARVNDTVFNAAAAGDGHYTATITKLQKGASNSVVITAKDNSEAANEAHKTIIVVYANSYSITYDGNGKNGGEVPKDTGTYTEGTKVTLSRNTGNLEKAGRVFAGWNTQPDGHGTDYAQGGTLTIGTENVTLYAKWTTNTYPVEFDLRDGSTPASLSVEYGKAVSRPEDPQRLGYDFSGWFGDSACSSEWDFSAMIITGPTVLYAKWAMTEYSITYHLNGSNGSGNPSSYTVASLKITLANPAWDGYDFGGWYANSNLTGTAVTTIPAGSTGAKEFWAKWMATEYVITYHLDHGTNHPDNPSSYTIIDPSITLSAPSRDGYDFSGWYGNSGLTGTAITVIPAGSKGPKEFWARWTAQCVITFDGQEATTPPNPMSKSITPSTPLGSLPADPARTSYFFDGWYTEPKGAGSRVTTSMTFSENTTVFAKWIIKDIENNIYSEVKIGNQVWMVENLKVTKYNDGTPIHNVIDSTEWDSLTTGAYCWYNNEIINKAIFGGLYNWHAVNTGKLAPKGWHVPTLDEIQTLLEFLIINGYNYDETKEENKVAKSLASEPGAYWEESDKEGSPGYQTETNNKSGFTAEPGGYRWAGETFSTGRFSAKGALAAWWTATEYEDFLKDKAELFEINNSEPTLYVLPYWKERGHSIRCIRD